MSEVRKPIRSSPLFSGSGLWGTALAGAAAGVLAACSASLPSGELTTGSVGESGAFFGETEKGAGASKTADAGATPSTGPERPGTTIAELAKAHANSPSDPKIALNYGRALKREGKRQEALAVLDAVAETDPKHTGVRVEQGLLALELGQTARAEATLQQVASAGTVSDWRVHSGLGVAASSLGRQKDAQVHFAKALELSPDNGAVLNNMAVSLLLDRKMDQAETLLRRASKAGAARQQVAQNLALAKALKNEEPGNETANP